jgi:hypothetical protein
MDPPHDICQMDNRAESPPRPGTTYHVIAEGAEHEWHSPTITVAQVRALAGWNANQAVVEVDLITSTEITLDPARPVTLKPGTGFARKIRFTRGIG